MCLDTPSAHPQLNMDIKALSGLLKSCDDENIITSNQNASTSLGPGCIGPVSKQAIKSHEESLMDTNSTTDIWNIDDVPDIGEVIVEDSRPQPEYDITYTQNVTSEDMFLGMSGKTHSASHADDMIVRVKLPETKFADCDLTVTDTFLDCRTKNYRLALHLPKPVKSADGNAKFASDIGVLTVTVPLKSGEFDFR